jgi:hypothetical protein
VGDRAGRSGERAKDEREEPAKAAPEAFIFDAVLTPRGRGKRVGALHGVKPVSLVVGLIDEPGYWTRPWPGAP